MVKSAKLAACVKLAHKVTIYVPGTVAAAEAGDTSEYITKAAEFLSGAFGGATSSAAAGYWLSAEHGLIKEKTTVVFAYAAEADLANNIDSVVDFCIMMRCALGQEAVALEIDGEMYFI